MNIRKESKLGETRHEKFEKNNHIFLLASVSYAFIFAIFFAYVAITNGADYVFDFDKFDKVVIPAWQAIILAIGIFIALFILPIFSMKTVDELEVQINMKACVYGILATVAIYPAWRILSFADLLPDPSADQTFLMIMGISIISYF